MELLYAITAAFFSVLAIKCLALMVAAIMTPEREWECRRQGILARRREGWGGLD